MMCKIKIKQLLCKHPSLEEVVAVLWALMIMILMVWALEKPVSIILMWLFGV